MSIHASALGGLDWRVSSTCEGGACVGVIRQGEVVMIGNTGNPDGPVSKFTEDEWRHFLTGAKRGDFDSLLDSL